MTRSTIQVRSHNGGGAGDGPGRCRELTWVDVGGTVGAVVDASGADVDASAHGEVA